MCISGHPEPIALLFLISSSNCSHPHSHLDNSLLIISSSSPPPPSFTSLMSPSPSTLSLLTSSDRPPPYPSAASIPSLLSSLTDPCSPPVIGRCVSTCQAPWQPNVPPHPQRGDRLPIRNTAVATLPAPPLYSPPPPPPPTQSPPNLALIVWQSPSILFANFPSLSLSLFCFYSSSLTALRFFSLLTSLIHLYLF